MLVLRNLQKQRLEQERLRLGAATAWQGVIQKCQPSFIEAFWLAVTMMSDLRGRFGHLCGTTVRVAKVSMLRYPLPH